MKILFVLLCFSIIGVQAKKKRRIHKNGLYLKQSRSRELVEMTIKKPLQDQRKYHYAELDNELEVVIIQDEKVKQAEVSLGVEVGSLSNPSEALGLAHFLEHMLFMGSQKYPSTTAMADCLSKYQGSQNAFTSQTQTIYFFSLVDQGLAECVDIFSNFFTQPLFDNSTVLKEVNAVDSEYTNYLNNQNWAQQYALQTLANPTHPFSRFDVGNLDSLLYQTQNSDISLLQHLHAFFDKYYSSNLMKLVIISRQEPSDIFQQIKPMFQQIKNHNVDSKMMFDQYMNIFRSESYLQKYVAKIQIIKLNVFFEIPNPVRLYYKKSINFIIGLFNNYQENGFHRYLKQNEFIYKFNAELYLQLKERSVAIFEFELTSKGYQKINNILNEFYNFIEQLKELDEHKMYVLYDEMAQISQVQFDFSQKVGEAYKLVQNLYDYQLDDLLYGDYKYGQFDYNEIQYYLKLLDKSLAQYSLGNDKFQYSKEYVQSNLVENLKSKYVTQENKYSKLLFDIMKSPIQIRTDEKNKKSYQFILQDEYIPSSDQRRLNKQQNATEYCNPDQIVPQVPELIYQNDHQKVWHMKQTQFELPQQIVNIQFYSPNSYATAYKQLLNRLLENYLDKLVQENLYQVKQLENIYQIEIKATIEGISLQFSGHSQHLGHIIEKFFELVNKHELNEPIYDLAKSEMQNTLQNAQKDSAYKQSMQELYAMLLKVYYTDIKLSQEIGSVSAKEFQEYFNQFFKNTVMESYCTGFIEKQDCKTMMEHIEKQLELEQDYQKVKKNLLKQQLSNIQNDKYKVTLKNNNKNDNNHCVIQYQQIGLSNVYVQTILSMIEKRLSSEAFEYLRSDKQLGYVVFGRMVLVNNVVGFNVVIQGSVHDVDVCLKEIDNYWQKMDQIFAEMMDESSFKSMVNSYATKLKQQDQTLQQNNDYFWKQIKDMNYQFKNKEYQLNMLQTLSRESLQDFYQNMMNQNHLILQLKNQNDYTKDDKFQTADQLQSFNTLKYFKPNKHFQ